MHGGVWFVRFKHGMFSWLKEVDVKIGKLLGVWVCSLLLIGGAMADVIYSNSFSGVAGSNPGGSAEVNPGLGALTGSTIVDGDGHLVSIKAVSGSRFSAKLSETPLEADQIILKWTMRATSEARWVGVGFHGEDGLKLNDPLANSGPWVSITSQSTKIQDGTAVSGGDALFLGTHEAADILSYEMIYYPESSSLDLSLNGSSLTNGYVIQHEFPAGVATNPSIQFVQMQIWVESTNDTAYIDDISVETYNEPPPVQVDVVYSNSFTGVTGTDPVIVAEVNPGLSSSALNTSLDGSGHLVSTNPIAGSRFIAQLGSSPLTSERIQLNWTMRSTSQTKWIGVGFQAEDTYKLNDTAGNSGPWFLITDDGTSIQDGTAADGPKLLFAGSHAAGDILEYEMTYYTASETLDLFLNGSALIEGHQVVHEFPVGVSNSPSIKFLEMQLWVESTNDTAYIDEIVVKTIDPLGNTNSPGLFQIGSVNLSDGGAGSIVTSVSLTSTNGNDTAFILEYTPDLVHSNWLPVATNLLRAPGGMLVHTNGAENPAGFYRVTTE